MADMVIQDNLLGRLPNTYKIVVLFLNLLYLKLLNKMGVAEKRNCTLKDMIRSMMSRCDLSKFL